MCTAVLCITTSEMQEARILSAECASGLRACRPATTSTLLTTFTRPKRPRKWQIVHIKPGIGQKARGKPPGFACLTLASQPLSCFPTNFLYMALRLIAVFLAVHVAVTQTLAFGMHQPAGKQLTQRGMDLTP